MTNANNPHAATDATLRQIFKAMDAHQAQEIREAYYKAIEGLMTWQKPLRSPTHNKHPAPARFSPNTSTRSKPGRDEEQPPGKDPLNHRPAECHGRRERNRGVLPLGRDTRPQSRSCEHLRQVPNIQNIATGPTSGPVRPPEKHGRTWEKLLEPA